MKLGHALVEGKPQMQKCPGHKKRSSESLKLCGWRLEGKDGREAERPSRKALNVRYGVWVPLEERKQVAKRLALGLRRTVWL